MQLSLEWLADWWPVFLIIFGIRMIIAGRHRRDPPA